MSCDDQVLFARQLPIRLVYFRSEPRSKKAGSSRPESRGDQTWPVQRGGPTKALKRPSSPFRLLLQGLDFASKMRDRDSVGGQLVFDFVEKMPQCLASIGCFGGLTDDPQGVPMPPNQVVPPSPDL